jgi:rRNA maturation endonuclease Nob1
MTNAGNIQKEMNRIQNSEEIANIFGKLVSGRMGYKAVIDVTKPAPKCEKCGKILEGTEKFCPDCGQPTSFVKK